MPWGAVWRNGGSPDHLMKRTRKRRRPLPGGRRHEEPIGAPGFEPGTSCSQSRRATGLRHTPKTDAVAGGDVEHSDLVRPLVGTQGVFSDFQPPPATSVRGCCSRALPLPVQGVPNTLPQLRPARHFPSSGYSEGRSITTRPADDTPLQARWRVDVAELGHAQACGGAVSCKPAGSGFGLHSCYPKPH